MKYVVSFSGGKDSTAMLLRLLEEGRPVDDIKNDGYSFRPNCSIADLDARFEREEKETQHEQQV